MEHELLKSYERRVMALEEENERLRTALQAFLASFGDIEEYMYDGKIRYAPAGSVVSVRIALLARTALT